VVAVPLILLELGLRKRLPEFRVQAYALAAAWRVGLGLRARCASREHLLGWLALSLAAAYACALRSRWHGGALDDDERSMLATGASAATAALAAILILEHRPACVRGAGVGYCWRWFSSKAGNRAIPRDAADHVVGHRSVRRLRIDWDSRGTFCEVPERRCLGVLSRRVPGRVAMTARAAVWPPANLGASERAAFADLMNAAGAFAAMALLWLVLPDPLVTPAWAVLGVAVARLES